MAIKDLQDLLTEQLGQNAGTEVFTTVAQTGKDYYCVYFPVESVVASITAASVTGVASLQTTLPAGTTLFMNITAITLTQGIGIGYKQ